MSNRWSIRFNPKRNGFYSDVFIIGMFATCVYFGFFGACLVTIGG